MDSLDEFLSKAEAVMCPSNEDSDYENGPSSSSLSAAMPFSSLDSLPSICEPTPIDTKNAVFVQEVPLAGAGAAITNSRTSCWYKTDRNFLQSLKMLIDETSSSVTNSSPIQANFPFYSSDYSSVNKFKRSRDDESPPFVSSSNNNALIQRQHQQEEQPSIKRQRTDCSTTICCTKSDSSSAAAGIRNRHVEQWTQRFKELVAFREEFNHCLVPLSWERNPSLAHWVKRQRHQYRIKGEGKHSTMTTERQTMLESLGFVWDSHAAGWEERLRELAQFKNRFGHTNVPKKYPANPQLAVWVKCQRRQFKLLCNRQPNSATARNNKQRGNTSSSSSSNMTAERVQRLTALGFVFNPRMTNKNNSSPSSSLSSKNTDNKLNNFY